MEQRSISKVLMINKIRARNHLIPLRVGWCVSRCVSWCVSLSVALCVGATAAAQNTPAQRFVEAQTRQGPLKNAAWGVLAVDADGNVLPCCYDKSEQFVLGNIREQSLRQIWHGAKAREFRRAVMTRRAQINICTNCDE